MEIKIKKSKKLAYLRTDETINIDSSESIRLDVKFKIDRFSRILCIFGKFNITQYEWDGAFGRVGKITGYFVSDEFAGFNLAHGGE